MSQVVVSIDPYGRVKLDAQGFTGQGCVSATEAVELVLGGGGAKKEKPEFYQPASGAVETIKQVF
jgi:hypothetical protein